jgi:hypothetical protein
MYACRDCGADAFLREGVVVRHCSCDAPVVAQMEAVARGESSARGVNPAFSALYAIGLRVMQALRKAV